MISGESAHELPKDRAGSREWLSVLTMPLQTQHRSSQVLYKTLLSDMRPSVGPTIPLPLYSLDFQMLHTISHLLSMDFNPTQAKIPAVVGSLGVGRMPPVLRVHP